MGAHNGSHSARQDEFWPAELHVQHKTRALCEVNTAAPRGWALHDSIMRNSRDLTAVMETG